MKFFFFYKFIGCIGEEKKMYCNLGCVVASDCIAIEGGNCIATLYCNIVGKQTTWKLYCNIQEFIAREGSWKIVLQGSSEVGKLCCNTIFVL